MRSGKIAFLILVILLLFASISSGVENQKSPTHQSLRHFPALNPSRAHLPNRLSWNTFQGSYLGDEATAVAMDSAGDVYVAGVSYAGWGRPINPFTSSYYGSDAFVAKLDQSGALVWNTFLGNGTDIVPCGVAVDGSGDVYVAGGDKKNPGQSRRIYIAKLDGDGYRLWNKSYGSSYGHITSKAMALDGGGNLYLTGIYPERCCSFDDGFVAKFDHDGNPLWTGYLQWTSYDACYAIALDGDGNSYVAGHSLINGKFEAFVSKFDQSGNRWWTTFFGGGDTDKGLAIALDAGGNVYAAGLSASSWGTPLNPHSGGDDAYIVKLDNNGNRLWNTFYGGTGGDEAHGLAIDGNGRVLVTGYSNASWGAPLNPHSGLSDIMLAKLASDGHRLWNTFLGGEGNDQAVAVTLNDEEEIHIAGYSGATWGAPINPYGEGGDAVVAKVSQGYTVDFAAESGGGLTGDITQVVSPGGDCTPVVAVPGDYHLFSNWTGTEGFTATPQNPVIVADVAADMTITANFRKILPPIQQLCEHVMNRSLMRVEYINVLCWSPNPGNADLGLSAYRVYEIINEARVLIADSVWKNRLSASPSGTNPADLSHRLPGQRSGRGAACRHSLSGFLV